MVAMLFSVKHEYTFLSTLESVSDKQGPVSLLRPTTST